MLDKTTTERVLVLSGYSELFIKTQQTYGQIGAALEEEKKKRKEKKMKRKKWKEKKKVSSGDSRLNKSVFIVLAQDVKWLLTDRRISDCSICAVSVPECPKAGY